MALVAYDNSDSSEYEEDENESNSVGLNNQEVEGPKEVATPSTSKPLSISQNSEPGGQNLFNLLPQPSSKKTDVVEEDDEFLHKKETVTNVAKPKARITVPSLNDFRDVEDRPIAKPKTSNGKKSGLLSMLPQPKNAASSTKTTSLIPNVLTKKPTSLVPTSLKKKDPLPSPMKKSKTEAKGIFTSYSDESDNDDESSTDFFSINKPIEILPVEDVQLDLDIPTQPVKTEESKPRSIESYFKKDVPENIQLEPECSEENNASTDSYIALETGTSYTNGNTGPESSGSNDMVLDEEAIRQLVGSRGKRWKEDIQIVDINQQEVLADAKEWMRRGLMEDTSKRASIRKKKGEEPTHQQKRKHQITYLAHQAKAQEAELQNQWANSKMSRRQTQSKYGF